MEDKSKRILSMIFFSLLLGLPGFGMALGDIGIGRTIMDWVLLGAGYFLFAGFLLGLIEPQYWYIAALVTWGPLLVLLAILLLNISHQNLSPMSFLMPLGVSLLGSWIGSVGRAKIGAR